MKIVLIYNYYFLKNVNEIVLLKFIITLFKNLKNSKIFSISLISFIFITEKKKKLKIKITIEKFLKKILKKLK